MIGGKENRQGLRPEEHESSSSISFQTCSGPREIHGRDLLGLPKGSIPGKERASCPYSLPPETSLKFQVGSGLSFTSCQTAVQHPNLAMGAFQWWVLPLHS